MSRSAITERSGVYWLSSLPPEIWTLVAEEIRGPQTLMSLIQVCHAFHDTFKPFLHQRHALRLSRRTPADWLDRPLPNGLAHIKAFEVILHNFEDERILYEEHMNTGYAKYVAKLLKEIPNLRSFRWKDSTYEDGYGPSLILQDEELLATLKRYTSLTTLSLQFSSQYVVNYDQDFAANCWTQLEGYRHLTSLELYNVYYRSTSKLVGEIANLLNDNPGLRMLGLGLACDGDCGGVPEALVIPDEIKFLEKLCIRYGSMKTSSPLCLHTLRLGHGMFLSPSEAPDNSNYLSKLINGDTLGTLHIFNGYVTEERDGDFEETEIEWSLFASCHSVRQLSVSRFTRDVRDWLNSGGNSVEEFIVTDHYAVWERDLDRFATLKLPRLSMLFVRERRVGTDLERTQFDYWIDMESKIDMESELDMDSEIESEATESDMDDGVIDLRHPVTVESGSDRPSGSEAESGQSEMETRVAPDLPGSPSQGISSSLATTDEAAPTILSRLCGGGSQLKRLALCLDFEDQWTLFSAQLKKLSHLTQLRMDSKSAHCGNFLRKESSLWPGVTKPREMAMRYAQLAKSFCPSLQYISVSEWVWHVTLPLGAILQADTDIYSIIQLRWLEYEEVIAIQLFAPHTFIEESGLLGTQEHCRELPDEERERLDLMMREVREAISEGRPIRRLDGSGPDIPLEQIM